MHSFLATACEAAFSHEVLLLYEVSRKVGPEPPEVAAARPADEKARGRAAPAGLVDKEQPRAGVMGKQRPCVGGHQFQLLGHLPPCHGLLRRPTGKRRRAYSIFLNDCSLTLPGVISAVK
jgi:hypothetical protein